MAILLILLFGALQGLTEFLPISSSGHLTLFQHIFEDIPESLTLNIAVHIGTLLTIVYFYRKDILDLIKGCLNKDKEALHMASLIVVAVLPTAVLGLIMKKYFSPWLTDVGVTGVCLLLTGFVLISTKWMAKTPEVRQRGGLNFKNAFLIGFIQGIAVLPGISRSGVTIVSALWLGVKPTEAARFSFLISVPAIAGAGLLECLSESSEAIQWLPMILAMISSFVVGLFAIYWVVLLTQKQKLANFAYYVWLLGLAALII